MPSYSEREVEREVERERWREREVEREREKESRRRHLQNFINKSAAIISGYWAKKLDQSGAS